MKRIIIAGLAAAAVCGSVVAADWTVEVVALGTKPEIVVDDDGAVHVAFVIEMPDGAISYATREPDGWDIETALPGYFAAPLDLVLDDQGRPHMAAHDHHRGNAVHVRGTSSSWVDETLFSSGHDGWSPSIAFDPDGVVHIASFDPADGVELAVRKPSGWEISAVGTGQLTDWYGAPLAIDGDGTVFLCFHDGSSAPLPGGRGSLRLMTRTNGSWETETIDDDGDVGKFSSLALDSLGRPHVAYLRFSETTAEVRYAYRDGEVWMIEDVPGLDRLEVGRSSARRTVTLALDAEDRPHLAVSDTKSVYYAVRVGAGWTVDTVTGRISEDFPLGQLTALALDPDGSPHIAFYGLPETGSTIPGTVYHAYPAPRNEPRVRRPSRRVAPAIRGKNTGSLSLR